MRKLFWMLCGVTLAVYLAMVLWSLPVVSAGAGGLAPFDMRPGGYDYAAAVAFLDAITPAAAAFYRDVQQRFDLVYPALAALTLFFALASTLPRPLGAWRFILAAPALLVAVRLSRKSRCGRHAGDGHGGHAGNGGNGEPVDRAQVRLDHRGGQCPAGAAALAWRAGVASAVQPSWRTI
ncbi:MAG: hypothetical protein EOP19_10320 [Hyphomicrobiales bacterium]|nr:MAG: hypothetical protein EOP19_10320 [Hyphomicrobiales bacterium]